MSADPIMLVDENPPDPDEAVAVAYMFRHLDGRIEEEAREWKTGAPSPSLRELLELRYGALPGMEKERGQSATDAIKQACASQRKPLSEGWNAYRVQWDDERARSAVRWFHERMKIVWPQEIEFLAEDLPTLHTACLAMDLAPVRSKPVADDPFPAPPILITGPTGAGKELLARAIHLRSEREPKPWNPSTLKRLGSLNCGGLPTELLESELFGHVRGAFTGADKKKRGFVEEYEEGTLFLDEIGDMPPEVQVRLLRFLNNGEFRAVGDNDIKKATPRIISATHVNLEARVKENKFREDLFFRVRGKRIRLRGLKDRPANARRELIRTFLSTEAGRAACKAPALTRRLWTALVAYEWPGNLRELRYVIEALIDEGRRSAVLDLEHLSSEIERWYRDVTPAPRQDVLAAVAVKEKGDAAKSAFVLAEALAVRFQHQRNRKDTRAATLTKASSFLSQLATNLQLEKQLSHQVRALDLASKMSVVDEFRVEWIEPTRKAAEEEGFDAERALASFEKAIATISASLQANLAELRSQVEKANKTYWVSNAIAVLVGAAETGALPYAGKIVDLLRITTQMSATPPLNDGIRALVSEIKDLSPARFKSKLNNLFETGMDAEEPDDMEPPESGNRPAWDDVKDNLEKIEELIAKHRTVTRAAMAVGVRAETVSRARTRLKKERRERKGRPSHSD